VSDTGPMGLLFTLKLLVNVFCMVSIYKLSLSLLYPFNMATKSLDEMF